MAICLRDDIDEEAHPSGIIIHGSVPDSKGAAREGGEGEDGEALEGEGNKQGGSADDDGDVVLVTEDEWAATDGENDDFRREKRKRTGDDAGMTVNKKGKTEEIVLLD